MKNITLVFTLVLISQWGFSQIPDNYYDNAEGLWGEELKAALHTIIKSGHVRYPYTSGSTDVWDILRDIDEDPSNPDNVILIYTGRSQSKFENGGGADDWNREHIWAKSHGFPDEGDYAYTDVHHLKPCDGSVNSTRGTKDFDNGGSPHNEATECFYDSDSWEPRDAVKGDVARMMFYMTVRYEGDGNADDDYDLELVDYTGTAVGSTLFGKLSTLIEWHKQDPVDDFERSRNDKIYYDYQHNRNPFIDHPEFVGYIWEDEMPDVPSITDITYTPEFPKPDEAIDVTANITDNVLISNAELKWGIDGINFDHSIPMWDSNNDSVYETSTPIPGQPDGTILAFKIEATDNEDNTTTTDVFQIEVSNKVFLLSEDFTDCPPENWIMYSVTGNEDWNCASEYMEINAYNADVNSDDWLISPSLNLDNYMEEMVTFQSWTKYTDINFPQLRLKYSTNYSGSGTPMNADWTVLSFTAPAEDSETWMSSGEIDLTSVSGNSVYIAFQYISSGTGAGTSTYWKLDDIVVTGKNFSDIEPPVFAEGYPIVDNIGGTSLDLKVKMNEPGWVYYVVQENGTIEPSINEVIQGDTLFVMNGNAEYSSTIYDLQPETSYDFYLIAEDDQVPRNRQDHVTKIEATTTQADTSPPIFITGYPEITNISSNSADLRIGMNEKGTLFYIVVEQAQPAPAIEELKEANSHVIDMANDIYTIALTSLSAETGYSLYCIAADDEPSPNIQINITSLDFQTLSSLPVIITQPVAQTACEGDDITVNVIATSASEISYQWYKNELALGTQDSNILILNNVSEQDNGFYFCTLENSSGTIHSDTVTLDIKIPPFAGHDTSFLVCHDIIQIDLLDYLPGADRSGIFFDNSSSGALDHSIFYVNQVPAGNYNFTYVVDGGPCEDDFSVLYVTVDECTNVPVLKFDKPNIYLDHDGFLVVCSTLPIHEIWVYNIFGQLKYRTENYKGKQIRVKTELKKGIYLVQIMYSDKTETLKIIK